MPRQSITPTVLDPAAATTVTPVAVVAADDAMFPASDRTFVRVANTGGSTANISINTPRTVFGLAVAEVTGAVPATTGVRYFGPFPANVFGQVSGADVDKVYFDTDQAVNVEVVRLP